jgi:hypothetical protein
MDLFVALMFYDMACRLLYLYLYYVNYIIIYIY